MPAAAIALLAIRRASLRNNLLDLYADIIFGAFAGAIARFPLRYRVGHVDADERARRKKEGEAQLHTGRPDIEDSRFHGIARLRTENIDNRNARTKRADIATTVCTTEVGPAGSRRRSQAALRKVQATSVGLLERSAKHLNFDERFTANDCLLDSEK